MVSEAPEGVSPLNRVVTVKPANQVKVHKLSGTDEINAGHDLFRMNDPDFNTISLSTVSSRDFRKTLGRR